MSHCTAPSSDGRLPSTGKVPGVLSATCTAPAEVEFCAIIAPLLRGNLPDSFSTSACSIPLVDAVENRARIPVSRPRAIAATPASIAPPRPRRSHSPAPIERFIAVKTLPPSNKASAREVAAPAAYASSKKVV
ncbi:hypothetical protein D9M69_512010 [compost metagenome]